MLFDANVKPAEVADGDNGSSVTGGQVRPTSCDAAGTFPAAPSLWHATRPDTATLTTTQIQRTGRAALIAISFATTGLRARSPGALPELILTPEHTLRALLEEWCELPPRKHDR